MSEKRNRISLAQKLDIIETVFCELFNRSHCDKKFADKPTARAKNV